MTETVIYAAREIITMNPSRPSASHVAVRDGRVLGVGRLDELQAWGSYRLDDRFQDKVLMPGFVEGHSHAMEGTFWRYTYCGYFDRQDPDGKIWPGAKTLDDAINRLRDAAQALDDPSKPLTAWSLDPIYYDNVTCDRGDLDRVSDTRPVGVLHASGHIMNVNSKALEAAGLLRQGVNHPGIPLAADGLPTGELRGPEAMAPVAPFVGFDRDELAADEEGLRQFARLCVRQGVTTATDLASMLPDDAVEMMSRVTGEPSYPTRIVPLRRLFGISPKDIVARALQLRERSSDRLRLGRIKIVVDGSIQGFSARLRWPGYFNGAPNGLWYVTPEELAETIELALAAGVQIHTHTNGDQATELVLDTMDAALRKSPSPDHRFTLQHCQLADRAQFRRMKAVGMCVNLFANHHYYWGDQHRGYTVGPDRAERMNACQTALDIGVSMAIHSDAPVTPLGPLFTAWCAVNRLTASNHLQGGEERIKLDDALYAITIGAAYTLKLDHEIGSIEVGKRADFAVLEDDPRTVPVAALKDVGIWGVVQDGRVFAAAEI